MKDQTNSICKLHSHSRGGQLTNLQLNINNKVAQDILAHHFLFVLFISFPFYEYMQETFHYSLETVKHEIDIQQCTGPLYLNIKCKIREFHSNRDSSQTSCNCKFLIHHWKMQDSSETFPPLFLSLKSLEFTFLVTKIIF